jgi:tetratricopeptide (TPR) repeat protein
MKISAFILLILLSTQCLAENLPDTLKKIESDWANIYYGLPKPKRHAAYLELLNKIDPLSRSYPDDAYVIYWQGLVKACAADYKNPLSALRTIHEVRDLLTRAVTINPAVMNGAGYAILGEIYDKVPGWPIGFGDDDKAKKMLEAALKISPDGMVSNYFYGDFLLSHDNEKAAELYFKKAMLAPIRPDQAYADTQFKKNKVESALQKMGIATSSK